MKPDVTIDIEGHAMVSGLWLAPKNARACLVLAHGAGAGMAHPSMTAIAEGLEERGVATLRFQFPYMERGSKRVDSPRVAHAAVRSAVAEAPLEDVRGLVFFGFPLHPAGAPSVERAAHLKDVGVAMLFLQGSNDALADVSLMRPAVAALGRRATLRLFADADHSFHVPKRSGRTNAAVMGEVLDVAAEWMFKT